MAGAKLDHLDFGPKGRSGLGFGRCSVFPASMGVEPLGEVPTQSGGWRRDLEHGFVANGGAGRTEHTGQLRAFSAYSRTLIQVIELRDGYRRRPQDERSMAWPFRGAMAATQLVGVEDQLWLLRCRP